MTALLSTQVRRLDRAERRWLRDARDRLRRTHDVPSPGDGPRGVTTTAREGAEAEGAAR